MRRELVRGRAGMAAKVRWSAHLIEFAMQVRPFLDSDEAAVIALWEAAGLTRSWNDPRKDIERKRSVQREWFLVGMHGDAVIASIMIGYDGHRGWINYLAVAPAHRRHGHARTLMREAERLLADAGCPKINLQIRTSNASVIEFYQSVGYAQDDVVSFGRRLIADE
jgi:ribosomal protein S18 acetylase RimI-like enzyme